MDHFRCKLLSKKNQDVNFNFAEMKKEVAKESKEGVKIAMINHTIKFTNKEGYL